MDYMEYLKLNPDCEATAAAADTLRRASEPAVPVGVFHPETRAAAFLRKKCSQGSDTRRQFPAAQSKQGTACQLPSMRPNGRGISRPPGPLGAPP
jgi:hypothetical protein